MKKYFLLLVFLAAPYIANASALLFKPLSAYIFEPRIGTFYQFSEEKLRLDIGTTVELINIDTDSSDCLR